jgi:hypothetical protein
VHFILNTNIYSALAVLGCGLILTGLALFIAYYTKNCSILLTKLSVAFLKLIKAIFIKKEAA